jgi:hypothetical protein
MQGIINGSMIKTKKKTMKGSKVIAKGKELCKKTTCKFQMKELMGTSVSPNYYTMV